MVNSQRKCTLSILALALFITSCSRDNEGIVSNYLSASHDNNFEKALIYLDSGYTEVFVNGSIEVQNLDQLKDLMEWRKEMETQSDILSISSLGDTVIVEEKTSNFMDEILEREARTFKLKYVLENGIIMKSIIDTLEGFSKTSRFNRMKTAEFQRFQYANRLNNGKGFTREGAIELKESLKAFERIQ